MGQKLVIIYATSLASRPLVPHVQSGIQNLASEALAFGSFWPSFVFLAFGPSGLCHIQFWSGNFSFFNKTGTNKEKARMTAC